MSPDEICFAPATELAGRIRARALSPVEVTEAFLGRIEARNGVLNAYVTLLAEPALAAARAAEAAVVAGEPLGPLHGVPIAIKDLFDFKAGTRSTFGSRPFADNVAADTATYVERLEAAGAIVLGKTNTPEFGCKGVTDNLLFGATGTPFAPDRNAGGSSGGSAAAVADGLAALAQGTDAGGSVRIPAAWCGVVGLKATWGRVASVSRPDGFVAPAPFVHSGALARTVADAALMLAVMSGPHPRDPFALPDDGLDWLAAPSRELDGLRIAFSPDLGVFPIDPRVAAVVEDAVGDLRSAGLDVRDAAFSLPRGQAELSACWTRQIGVLYATAAALLAREGRDLLRDHRDELTPEFAALLEDGARRSAVEHRLDDVIRTEVLDAFEDLFSDHDVLLCPTLAVPPVPNAGDGTTTGPASVGDVPVDPSIGWCLTYPVNFTGHPAASVPAGLDADGLPVGLQVIGRRHDDATVVAVCAALERIRPWSHTYARRPGVPA